MSNQPDAGQPQRALEHALLLERARWQEQQLAAIIQSAAEPIIITDSAGRISALNKAAQMLFRIGAHNLVGQNLLEAPLNPQFREALVITMRDPGDSGRFDFALPDGRPAAALITRLHPGGTTTPGPGEHGWVIVVREVSPAARAERAQLEFMENVAHDLRNPLGVATSALSMLRDSIDTADPDLVDIFGIASEATDRMQALIDDLLNLETIQSGGIQRDEVDVALLLSDALYSMWPVLDTGGLTCRLDVAQDLPVIQASYSWLYRAVLNYLGNAVKYTPPGGEIVLQAVVDRDELLIEVRDTGPGIPPEAQGRLFERFYRAPSKREEVRGSGLGLAIVKSVAVAHQGRVYVQSEPGTGSRFGLALPLDQ
jgi:PAS domain S-box-containing protein